MIKRLAAALGAAVLALTLVQPAQADTKYNLVLGGASPGGLWSLLGAGIDKAMKAAYPGSTVTYQTSGGGFANIKLLSDKTVQMGIVHDAELKIANEGGPPLNAVNKDLRAIAYLYRWAPMHLIATKEAADKYGLKTLADIAAKKAPLRIAVNRRGNVAADVAVAALAAGGVTEAALKGWGGSLVYAASKEQSELILNRRVDVLFNSLFVRHRSLRKIDESIDVVILGLSGGVIDKVNASSGTTPFTIKGGSYKNQPGDVTTMTLGAELVVDASMSAADAYNITKALVDNVDKISGIHKAMNALDTKLMAGQKVVPYHPGAEKYYREVGLIK